ncbi:MAG: outer membrane protein assembly factor BamD [Kiritimatiellaeota bacterium]|nr:outer membrane protein assembly factor BamD [Kiritimatiellota bacterium]
MSATHTRRRCLAAVGLLLCAGFCLEAGAAAQPYSEFKPARGWNFFLWPAKAQPAAQLAYALELQQAGRIRAALRQLRALIIAWPSAPEAPNAQLAYARLLDKREEWTTAFEEYTYLIEHYAGSFPYAEVLDRQFAIAQLVMHRRKAKFLFFPGFHAPEQAVPLLEKVIAHGPEGAHAAEAQALIGRAYALSQQYELAIVAYATTQVRYPNSPFAEQAALARAVCLERLAREAPHNEASLDEAWSATTQFLQRYPNSGQAADAVKLRDELYRRRARIAFDRAVYYDRIARKPQAAMLEYQDFIRLFPYSDWTAQAQQRVKMLSQVKEKSDVKAHQDS